MVLSIEELEPDLSEFAELFCAVGVLMLFAFEEIKPLLTGFPDKFEI